MKPVSFAPAGDRVSRGGRRTVVAPAKRKLRGGLVFGRCDAAEVTVFEAVAVAFEAEDFGVVNEPVDHRGGGDLVAEDLAPCPERLV
jgi:hypothetical protein